MVELDWDADEYIWNIVDKMNPGESNMNSEESKNTERANVNIVE